MLRIAALPLKDTASAVKPVETSAQENQTEPRTSTAQTTEPPTANAAALVEKELEAVERRLNEVLASREPLLTEIADHLVGAGGKRVRPAVTLLVHRACGGNEIKDAVDVAVALELIHSASLLHDDIIDENDFRRGRDSARAKYGVASTLIAGDFLFSRAFQICGRFRAEQIEWAAEACIALTEGEILQSRFRNNPALTLQDYREIIYRKTAALFEQGARISASLACSANEMVEAIANCARNVGLTFQIIDDLLDISDDQAKIGKPIGTDVREGNPSLPIVFAIAEDEQAAALFAKPDINDEEIRFMLERLRRPEIGKRGRELALHHGHLAHDELAKLPGSIYRDSLHDLIEQLLNRVT